MEFSRSTLLHRHRLSHQQIDQLLGEKKSGDYLPEKLTLMEQLSLFLKITEQFKKQGIHFIILKGPLLSQRIYGDPTFRLYKDFDILIQPAQLDLVIKILLSLGFIPDYFNWPRDNSRERIVIKHLNQYPLSHPVKGINVELHWRLFSNHLLSEKDSDLLQSENLIDVPMAGQPYRQFNTEFELLYLVIHGGLHAWRRLKWLLDVHEILQRFSLDEAKILDLTHKLEAGRMVALCNAMLKEFFPESKQMPCNESPKRYLLKFAKESVYRETEILSKSFPATLKRARFKLTAFPGLRYKLSAFRFSTFTQKEVNENWFPPLSLLVVIGRVWRMLLNKIH